MSESIGLRDELTDAIRREPFVPFQIVMSSGDRYKILDSLSVALGRDVVVILPRNGAHISLRFNQVNSINTSRTKRNR
jgi:hypothetical protein